MRYQWQWLPITLVVTAVVLACGVAVAHRSNLGWWQFAVYASGLMALAATFWLKREWSHTEAELVSIREELLLEQTRLEDRERRLDERFRAYHEWMEFPVPVNLREPAAKNRETESVADQFDVVTLSDEQLRELGRKDRELVKLLKDETNQLYDRILNGRYAPDGTFQLTILRDDAFELAHKVAKLYQPNANQPLIETNPALVVRAANRVCVQLLAALDNLPLGIGEASLSSFYSYMQNAVAAYRAYQKVEPYWPYVQGVWFVGRLAMGATPVTLGAQWFLSALGMPAAKKIATRVVNRQALKLLSDLVRVIGYEVAGMYAGDFRHRDPNWIYAAELTELMSQFPLSRDGLSHALNEMGAIELRSEYDRVFLYRCLATHVSARPDQYRPQQWLTAIERSSIASRLERFYELHIHGRSASRVRAWHEAAESRLGVKLRVTTERRSRSDEAQLREALKSLAAFLLDVKEREPPELNAMLSASQLQKRMSDAERTAVWGQIGSDPPYYFEPADLDPESDVVPLYIHDLAMLQATVRPRDPRMEEVLLDVAAYLRYDAKKTQAIIDGAYAAALTERVAQDVVTRNVPAAVARAVLDVLETGEQATFLYGGIRFEWPEGVESPKFERTQAWLVGTQRHATLIEASESPRVLWRGDSKLTLQSDKGLLSSECRLSGGEWLALEQEPVPVIVISGPMMSSFANYFRPLQALVDASATPRI